MLNAVFSKNDSGLWDWSIETEREQSVYWLSSMAKGLKPTLKPLSFAVCRKPVRPWQTQSLSKSYKVLTDASLVIDGLPPIARGSTQPGHDNELELLRLFPDAVFFIEKPISSAEIPEVVKVKEALSGRVVSVGYMLRYAKGECTVSLKADDQPCNASSE